MSKVAFHESAHYLQTVSGVGSKKYSIIRKIIQQQNLGSLFNKSIELAPGPDLPIGPITQFLALNCFEEFKIRKNKEAANYSYLGQKAEVKFSKSNRAEQREF